ncbi:radical SAM/SPASM domain-containing protein [Spirochaeta isovalerica]|uniref:Radical SAM protein with 4Fe4S-binding SPASM domain n=1 Tax=Spirochaeta isovalerica TaxID=150 RepID=A0A841R705_9SPIO|nr:radical SAM protein [Spirochaeta isovalerica]MBB6479625.1 radical SAM protein with 4Fe4S-binding SPASM domain [Spirochaeta isovalerica]
MGELRDRILAKYKAQNRLNAVMIEVTHRCPCSCIHCYIPDNPPPELTLEEFKILFSQLKEEGVFDLGFTGGEPFIRKDMWDILKAASKEGFFLTVLSTGLLWKKKDIARLKKVGVQAVEISLLGGRAETHDSIMKFPGAFEHLKKTIPLLAKEGIGVVLKTTLLRENYRELPLMEELARELKVEYAALVNVSSRLDGDNSPRDHALGAEELKEIPMKYIVGQESLSSCHNQAYLTCNAGKIFGSITPEGDVLPCLMFRRPVGNIRKQTLKEIWHDDPDPYLIDLREMKDEDVEECYSCSRRDFCPRCPAMVYLDTGDIKKKSPNACRMAEVISGIGESAETAAKQDLNRSKAP